MRIISGRFKGRTIRAPKNLPVRPTTDMAKEGLFNILHNRLDFEELKVLDLFCGTGNISYEFQSRNVLKTKSVDASFKCVVFVNNTMDELGCGNYETVKSDVLRFVNNAYEKWDLIFADPPYDFPNYEKLTEAILSGDMLEPDGLLIIEHPAEVTFKNFKSYLETRKYGRVHFSFFRSET
ncbi:MAG: RsmD family RNA methyltransferase [Flavobacteriales bacterium]|nr:RsmD family RNA methyltransferase [Flavobacteriales bacterium]